MDANAKAEDKDEDKDAEETPPENGTSNARHRRTIEMEGRPAQIVLTH
jgi:hypothetical protein